MTEPVISPIAAELVDSVSRTGITIAGMRAPAALSSEASTTNTTMVNAMCPRPPHQAGRLLVVAGIPAFFHFPSAGWVSLSDGNSARPSSLGSRPSTGYACRGDDRCPRSARSGVEA